MFIGWTRYNHIRFLLFKCIILAYQSFIILDCALLADVLSTAFFIKQITTGISTYLASATWISIRTFGSYRTSFLALQLGQLLVFVGRA
mmetsp:Transcript_13843/g.11817  ORF Transcript_13843/g.11817 Transcript_13843/m.11817 type:complete len:89 (-) Transcript_13843:1993-2259(-)